MMGFTLKIFFIGLIAFVPGPEGRDMTVLLVDGSQGYAVSDGTWIDEHVPVLIARSGSCSGSCRSQSQEVADLIYKRGQVDDPAARLEQLENAIQGGGVWLLDGSELSIRTKTAQRDAAPALEIRGGTTSRAGAPSGDRAAEFGWVADIGKIDPRAALIDPDLVADRPQKGLVAARLRLEEGSIGTHRLVAPERKVVPLSFETIRGEGPEVDYSQALADLNLAEIRVEGCSISLHERSFDGSREPRTLELAPERCDGTDVVEVALINLPRDSFSSGDEKVDPVGKHFEMYYELAYMRPPNRLRPVPQLTGDPEGASVAQGLDTPFLEALSIGWRGIFSRPLCPTVRFTGVGPR